MKIRKLWMMGVGVLVLSGMFGVASSVSAADLNVNVANYGANGADTNADTDAIQDALDAVAKAGAGTVEVPAGNYYLDDSLVISSNTTLKLAPNATMVRKDPTKPMLRDYKGAVREVLADKGYGHAQNIIITGGTWNGNISGTSSATPEGIMRIYCAKNVTISDCIITGVGGHHHVNLGAVDTATISNVRFTGFVKYSGTDYSSLETGEGNTNAVNSTASITTEALQLDYFEKKEYYCKNINVNGCEFDGVISGVGNHHKEGRAENIVITNNTFKNIENTCVNLYSFKNVRVSNNIATNVRAFARVYAGNNCTLSGNNINAYANAAKNKFNMFRISDKAVLTIDNNVICGSGVSVIKLDTGSNATITNNTIRNATLYGVLLNNSRAYISGNTISQAGKDGIRIDKGKVTVSDTNKVSGSKGRGLRVLSGTAYVESGNAKMLVKDKELIVSGIVDAKVTEVVVPAKVKFDKEIFKATQIGNNAFKNKKKLVKVTIGANVKKIGKNAFRKCSKLQSIVIKSKKLTKKSVAKGAFSKINKNCKFELPANKTKAYKSILKAVGAP